MALREDSDLFRFSLYWVQKQDAYQNITAGIQLKRHLQLFCWGKAGRKDRFTRSTRDASNIAERKPQLIRVKAKELRKRPH